MSVEDELGNFKPRELCWSALARVVDDEPTFVFADGDANGMTVECMVLTGPFQGATVAAMIACPLGATFETRPIRSGNRVLLQFLDGTPDGEIVAVATVPGGAANKIPTAMAGIAFDEGALQKEQLVAPPKGANVRFYVRGGAFLVRLKGDGSKSNADGTPFVGEFAVEADDASSTPGTEATNTAIRLALNPSTKKLAIKARLADGTALELSNGVASLTSPNGQNTLQVSNDDVRVLGKAFYVDVGTVCINGTAIGVNVPPGVPFTGPVPGLPSTWICGNVLLGGIIPPTPVSGAAYSVAGPANVISTTVLIAPAP